MLKTTIEQAIAEAQKGAIARKILFTNGNVNGKNEFLFFIKPDLTLRSESINLPAVLDLVLNKINDFNLSIKNIFLLSANYLEKYSLIARHYGVINAIAANAKEYLSASAKQSFTELMKVDFEPANILGGIELIHNYPEISPTALDYIWQNSPMVKLGGGAYCQKITLDGKEIFLVNGFHPRQLEHFIAKGRSIVAFTLVGDTHWEIARNEFIGKTNPAAAAQGSIRRTLLDNKDIFGLQAVTSSWNGVHLSAGPVEGLVELMRYNTNFEAGEELQPKDFSFGKLLLKNFPVEYVDRILSNCPVEYKGNSISTFDLTEEKNADEAVDILISTMKNEGIAK